MWKRFVKLVPSVVALVAATAVLADDFEIDWWTIDDGGHMFTTGGEFELSGTVGQPDANAIVMTGGDYELSGGFWPGVEEFCYADLTGDGQVGLNDLAQLLANYGDTGAAYEDGDLDADGDVDLQDLAELLARYGDICW